MAPLKLLFVTGNPWKLEFVRSILGSTVDLESISLEIPELQGTIEEIARDKCRRAADIVCDVEFRKLIGIFRQKHADVCTYT